MALAGNLGFPRIGAKRELKTAVESYWAGKTSLDQLLATGAELRQRHWKVQADAGIDLIPSYDFAWYDHILEHACLFGAIPAGYGWNGGAVSLATYFALARGRQGDGHAHDHAGGCTHGAVQALEMTKWFDTNYHYIVPDLAPDQKFELTGDGPLAAYNEAKGHGITTRPVLVGPLTFLKLSKRTDGGNPLELFDRLLPIYEQLVARLAAAGVQHLQLDEPVLAFDLNAEEYKLIERTAAALTAAAPSLAIHLTTYFGPLAGGLEVVARLPYAGLHVDLVRGKTELPAILDAWPAGKTLSLGLIDGRNIWRTDLEAALTLAQSVVDRRGHDKLVIAPSSSLLHSPVDLSFETELDDEARSWLSFAHQKLDEVKVLARALTEGRGAVGAQLDESRAAVDSRRSSPRIHKPEVKARLAALTEALARRQSPYAQRRTAQQARLGLPMFPTTTIGSFPQTGDVRQARAAFKRGDQNQDQYDAFLRSKIDQLIEWQEKVGIDVLVHGEFERNDMVEYFGELLDGFLFTKNGWVQSYGSRCVKPPIIFGDVARPEPMTVAWTAYAQSKAKRPVKGMLTGPVTILQWSFVRDDQPRRDTCLQIAFAVRDEVVDLEKAGIGIIQIDEPAIREGLPLRRDDWAEYLKWAVQAFQVSAAGVRDETQIHTHMCYSEFNDIIEAIAAMDADVISIETARSKMELLDAFETFHYPNQIGPGVWDIHSPRVPAEAEMAELLVRSTKVLEPNQIWVNPDCGLKTRGWPEVEASLGAMVEAARALRQRFAEKA